MDLNFYYYLLWNIHSENQFSILLDVHMFINIYMFLFSHFLDDKIAKNNQRILITVSLSRVYFIKFLEEIQKKKYNKLSYFIVQNIHTYIYKVNNLI